MEDMSDENVNIDMQWGGTRRNFSDNWVPLESSFW